MLSSLFAERASRARSGPGGAPPIGLLRCAGALALVATGAACGPGTAPSIDAQAQSTSAPPAAPAPAAGAVRAQVLGAQLSRPWGLAFLPDGRMLVTQKGGQLVIVRADGSAVEATVTGVPAVEDSGQGGLLDVAVDPDFATAPWVYLTYAEAGSGGSATTLARGRLDGTALRDVTVLFRQQPKVRGGTHFGSRIVFRADKTLYLALGDRGQDSPSSPTAAHAQNPAVGLGKLLRLNRDGSVPAGNPSFGAGAVPGLWSIGHRNIQGAALRPGSDELWVVEHGPRGGDELNLVKPGLNYGWPLASYGCPYSRLRSDTECQPGGGTHAPRFEEPRTLWQPTSTAPSGLVVYSGERFPEWRGQLFTGALAGTTLWRIAVDADGKVLSRDEVPAVKALGQRIRDVEQGPDGWLYLLSDAGRIVRVER